jgi:DNA-binding MarR family transcriptional regulator
MASPPSGDLLSPRELAAWRGLLETHSRLIARLDTELEREHGLPLTAYEVLMYLGDAGGMLRMGELADRLLLSRSGITRLVDRLERQGLVERRRCSDDGRGLNAVLTDAGLAALRAATPGHAALVRRMFFDGLDPDALPALRAALEAVHEQVLGAGTLPRPPRHQHRLPGLQTGG